MTDNPKIADNITAIVIGRNKINRINTALTMIRAIKLLVVVLLTSFADAVDDS